MTSQVLFGLTLALLLAAGTNATKVKIKNNCPRTIWPTTLIGDNSNTIDVLPPWNDRLWARTRCTINASNKFICTTGDYGFCQISCNG
ncbi:hypothetical protein UlMin_005731 [Ulmus minor]